MTLVMIQKVSYITYVLSVSGCGHCNNNLGGQVEHPHKHSRQPKDCSGQIRSKDLSSRIMNQNAYITHGEKQQACEKHSVAYGTRHFPVLNYPKDGIGDIHCK